MGKELKDENFSFYDKKGNHIAKEIAFYPDFFLDIKNLFYISIINIISSKLFSIAT
jgi:hypothetical protein